MALSDICKGVDENGISIHALSSLDARMVVGIFHDLEVYLVEGLDVIACERNRYENKVSLSTLHILLDCIACLGSKPGRWSHLRLPTKPVGVAEVQSLHYCVDSCCNLCWIGVTYEFY